MRRFFAVRRDAVSCAVTGRFAWLCGKASFIISNLGTVFRDRDRAGHPTVRSVRSTRLRGFLFFHNGDKMMLASIT